MVRGFVAEKDEDDLLVKIDQDRSRLSVAGLSDSDLDLDMMFLIRMAVPPSWKFPSKR